MYTPLTPSILTTLDSSSPMHKCQLHIKNNWCWCTTRAHTSNMYISTETNTNPAHALTAGANLPTAISDFNKGGGPTHHGVWGKKSPYNYCKSWHKQTCPQLSFVWKWLFRNKWPHVQHEKSWLHPSGPQPMHIQRYSIPIATLTSHLAEHNPSHIYQPSGWTQYIRT